MCGICVRSEGHLGYISNTLYTISQCKHWTPEVKKARVYFYRSMLNQWFSDCGRGTISGTWALSNKISLLKVYS